METGVLEAIENAASSGRDVWEMVISAGIDASDKGDEARWMIGDLALLVKKSYGDDAIGKFAKDIHAPVKRVEEYRTVCAFWDRQKSARADFLAELKNVYYSHYREALRLGDYDKAVQFIEDCALNDWTYEAARLEVNKRLGKPEPSAKILDTVARVEDIDGLSITIGLSQEHVMKLFPGWRAGRFYRWVVTEVKPDKQAVDNRHEQPEMAAVR